MLDSNITFMEAPTSVLTHETRCQAFVSVPQSVAILAGVSARKTGLEQYTTDLLLNSGPSNWQDRCILLTDGTKKGQRRARLFF